MSDSSDKNNPLDLSALDFGPAWVREGDNKKSFQKFECSEDRRPKGKKKFADRRKSDCGDRNDRNDRGGRGGYRNDRGERGGNRFERRDRSDTPQRRVREPLPEVVKSSIMPIESGIDNLAKQIGQTGRTYSVFDLARVILKSRDRYNIAFQVKDGSELVIFQSKTDGASFLNKEEAVAHFSQSEKFAELYKTVEVEVEPPSGNFPTIACCGFTGEPIAPPNYHSYQLIVAERHAADFSNMSLDNYRRRIKTERDDEKVSAWLESMKKQTRFQLVSDEAVEFASKKEAVEHFSANGFKEEYAELKKAFVKSDISFSLVSSGLASGLLEVIADQNKYPGELSSFLCRQLSGRHLAVYKWQGKLHAGPSRPHAIPEGVPMADRPTAILKWAQENSGAGIDELWKDVFPEAITEEEKAGWYHDLHWLLNQGYLVLLENGTLHLSSDSKKKPVRKQAKKTGKPSAKKEATPKPEAKAISPEAEGDKAAEKSKDTKVSSDESSKVTAAEETAVVEPPKEASEEKASAEEPAAPTEVTGEDKADDSDSATDAKVEDPS